MTRRNRPERPSRTTPSTRGLPLGRRVLLSLLRNRRRWELMAFVVAVAWSAVAIASQLTPPPAEPPYCVFPCTFDPPPSESWFGWLGRSDRKALPVRASKIAAESAQRLDVPAHSLSSLTWSVEGLSLATETTVVDAAAADRLLDTPLAREDSAETHSVKDVTDRWPAVASVIDRLPTRVRVGHARVVGADDAALRVRATLVGDTPRRLLGGRVAKPAGEGRWAVTTIHVSGGEASLDTSPLPLRASDRVTAAGRTAAGRVMAALVELAEPLETLPLRWADAGWRIEGSLAQSGDIAVAKCGTRRVRVTRTGVSRLTLLELTAAG